MKADFIIRNGRVIDPAAGIDEVKDIAVRNMRVIDEKDAEGGQVIDAEGCLVVPGLIDFHTHLFHEGSNICIKPDLMIAHGTTAAVDAGSAGTATYEAFYKTVVASSLMRVKGFLTLYAGGQLDPKLLEDFNPALYNIDKAERVVDRYRDSLLGLKIRISKGVVPDDKAAEYLQAVVDIAEELTKRTGVPLRVCVHTTNSPITAGELAGILRKGDIFCHCFQGAGNTIVMEDGTIDPGVLAARERGVIFDAANGKGNFGVRTAEKALAAGFLPDIISTDLTVDKFNMPPYAKNLPTLMSKYLSLGMNLTDVIRAVTEMPARLMGLEGEIGTLRPGSAANVTILKQKDLDILHKDFRDDELLGHTLLVPQLTMIDGEVQYCQTDFWY